MSDAELIALRDLLWAKGVMAAKIFDSEIFRQPVLTAFDAATGFAFLATRGADFETALQHLQDQERDSTLLMKGVNDANGS